MTSTEPNGGREGGAAHGPGRPPVLPLSLTLGAVPRMVNAEIADHPVYDGIELQWFDDAEHGTGMLAFLSRRTERTVDYYAQPGLRLDRAAYHLGAGTGSWQEVTFEAARLEVADDGVDVEVRFRDVDGRLVEVRLDDRDGRRRRRAGLLAPVGSGIDRPTSLFLVWMPRFDLLHATGRPPVVRIDGQDVGIGRLPGARLHRRHLVKCAAPVVVAQLNLTDDGAPSAPQPAARPEHDADDGLTALVATHDEHHARLALTPGMPAPASLADGELRAGRWELAVDGTTLTGGPWRIARRGVAVALAMDVDRPWRPERLPPLLRLVTTVAPVFRRWPTTYRWRATVRLDDPAAGSARWARTGPGRDEAYRRAAGSGGR